MKKIKWFWFVLLFVTINATAQTEADRYVQSILKQEAYILNGTRLAKEYKPAYLKYNFSLTWMDDIDNEWVLGFIGDDYERLRIKLLSVTKDVKNPGTYFVRGKSKVKNNICDFKGTFQIIHIRLYNEKDRFEKEFYKDSTYKNGIVIAKYKLSENATQKHTGVLEGILASNWYIPKKKNKIYLDDLMNGADGYQNNQFVGVWKSHNKKEVKRCNWGDSRIPHVDDCSVCSGDGEFTPNRNYLSNGWQSFIDAKEARNAIDDEDIKTKSKIKEWWE
ncbi:MAG: hypothetical protein IPJ81_11975 [Chitinophagaceae bacterium]|nr:hypothetical protein [Chitinophagaceae bacterium]